MELSQLTETEMTIGLNSGSMIFFFAPIIITNANTRCLTI